MEAPALTTSSVVAPAVSTADQARIAAALEASCAANTARAYRSGWEAWQRWATEYGHQTMPAAAVAVAAYLAHRAEQGASVATVRMARAPPVRRRRSVQASGRGAGAQGLVAHQQGPRPRSGAGARLARRRSRRGRRRERRPITRRPPRCGTHPGHVGCAVAGQRSGRAGRRRRAAPGRRQRHRDGHRQQDRPGRARARALPRRAHHAAVVSVAQRRRHRQRRAVCSGRCSRMAPPSRGASALGQSARSSSGAPPMRALPGACPGTRSGSAPLNRWQQPAPALWNCRKRAIGRRPPCRRTTHATSSPHAAPSPSCATRRDGKGSRQQPGAVSIPRAPGAALEGRGATATDTTSASSQPNKRRSLSRRY